MIPEKIAVKNVDGKKLKMKLSPQSKNKMNGPSIPCGL